LDSSEGNVCPTEPSVGNRNTPHANTYFEGIFRYIESLLQTAQRE
jgi:hypothetical protein